MDQALMGELTERSAAFGMLKARGAHPLCQNPKGDVVSIEKASELGREMSWQRRSQVWTERKETLYIQGVKTLAMTARIFWYWMWAPPIHRFLEGARTVYNMAPKVRI